MLPLLSVTVRVTVLSPRSAIVKLALSMDKPLMPHASLLPLLMSLAVVVALPFASNCTVMSCATTAGTNRSCTVTVALLLALLPLVSMTVRLTVLAPTSAHVKLVGDADSVSMATLSLLPLLMSLAVMVAFPLPSSCTV